MTTDQGTGSGREPTGPQPGTVSTRHRRLILFCCPAAAVALIPIVASIGSIEVADVVLGLALLITGLLTLGFYRTGVGARTGVLVPVGCLFASAGMFLTLLRGHGNTGSLDLHDAYFGFGLPIFAFYTARTFRRQLWPGDHSVLVRGLMDSLQLVLTIVLLFWFIEALPAIATGLISPGEAITPVLATIMPTAVISAPLIVRSLRLWGLGTSLLGVTMGAILLGAWVYACSWHQWGGSVQSQQVLAESILAGSVLLAAPAYIFATSRPESARGPAWLAADLLPLFVHVVAWAIGVVQVLRYGVELVSLLLGVCSLTVVAARIAVVRANERKLLTDLEEIAYTDPLTGVGNRRALMERLTGSQGWLLAMDLDGFKEVNDRNGHAAGDEVLREFAERVQRVLPAGAQLARIGGDEFAVVLPESADAAQLAADIVLAARSGRHSDVSVSVGVTRTSALEEPEVALRNADIATQSAKRAGKDRVAQLNEELLAERLRELEIAEHLRQHVEELTVVYQPICALTPIGPQTVAFEALARLTHPDLGELSPAEFIPVAERHGLIGSVGRVVLRTSLAQLGRWRAAGTMVQVSVNVSGLQLRQEASVDDLRSLLLDDPELARWVVLEVTESVYAEDEVALDGLQRLRECGVALALDDFGTGTSTLTTLRRLPIDMLKLDGELTRDLDDGSDDDAGALVDLVVRLGRRLQVAVVAEAVETDAQATQLAALGCDFAQGYRLGRPQPNPVLGEGVPFPMLRRVTETAVRNDGR